ncbi:flagellar protein FlaG [Marinimicrobium locisalis]|uniref:flagellar protein FlaG n=1 Tax=Marinimicrobium locisalis TaxID=546022 RepID=UPI003221EFD5
MSEVSFLQSSASYESPDPKRLRPASPDSTRQAAEEGGKVLPPSVSSIPQQNSRSSETQQLPEVEEAVTQMNEYIQSTQRDLRFSIDEELGETIVKVVDRQTDEVIRQIPDEVFLELARRLQDSMEPLHFFNEQA